MLFEVDENVIVVNNAVHGSCHNEGCQHIKYGMLLDEYGSQYDGNTQDTGGNAHPFLFAGLGTGNSYMAPSELYTWMLGQRLVGVSVL